MQWHSFSWTTGLHTDWWYMVIWTRFIGSSILYWKSLRWAMGNGYIIEPYGPGVQYGVWLYDCSWEPRRCASDIFFERLHEAALVPWAVEAAVHPWELKWVYTIWPDHHHPLQNHKPSQRFMVYGLWSSGHPSYIGNNRYNKPCTVYDCMAIPFRTIGLHTDWWYMVIWTRFIGSSILYWKSLRWAMGNGYIIEPYGPGVQYGVWLYDCSWEPRRCASDILFERLHEAALVPWAVEAAVHPWELKWVYTIWPDHPLQNHKPSQRFMVYGLCSSGHPSCIGNNGYIKPYGWVYGVYVWLYIVWCHPLLYEKTTHVFVKLQMDWLTDWLLDLCVSSLCNGNNADSHESWVQTQMLCSFSSLFVLLKLSLLCSEAKFCFHVFSESICRITRKDSHDNNRLCSSCDFLFSHMALGTDVLTVTNQLCEDSPGWMLQVAVKNPSPAPTLKSDAVKARPIIGMVLTAPESRVLFILNPSMWSLAWRRSTSKT